MRLVFKPRGANAGLNRYKGKGIYKSIGRKVYLSGVRKRTKEEADADPDKKIERGEDRGRTNTWTKPFNSLQGRR